MGHWEGDTLVVDATGMNDRTWLDAPGTRTASKVKVTEKFTRPDMNTLRLEATIDDPEFYTKPWTVVTTATWRPGQELISNVHLPGEQSRDLGHIGAERGKTTSARQAAQGRPRPSYQEGTAFDAAGRLRCAACSLGDGDSDRAARRIGVRR